jgi:5-methylcytosine-specific restriction enzyme subunit McrC
VLLELQEYGEPVITRIPGDVAIALRRTGLVDLVPEDGRGLWSVRPIGKVGAVSAGPVQIRVAPKLAINRVVYLLSYNPARVSWQDSAVGVEQDDDIVHVLAGAFLRSLTRTLKAGLLQGYRITAEALPVVRGRIRIDEQLKRRPGLWLPIEVEYDDYTVDIAENRILRAAIERLARNPLVDAPTRRRLGAVALTFADVSRLTPGLAPPSWTPSRLNQQYHNALHLADLILAASSFEHRMGTLSIDGFVLDMAKIFEDFVTFTLGAALTDLAPESTVASQYPTTLDAAGQIDIRPDVVWLAPNGGRRAVIDVKYKAEKPAGFPNADIYQALSYAVSLGLDSAHLIYAQGNETVRTHVVREAGIAIHIHTLDVSATPSGLLAEVANLARRIGHSTHQVGISSNVAWLS